MKYALASILKENALDADKLLRIEGYFATAKDAEEEFNGTKFTSTEKETRAFSILKKHPVHGLVGIKRINWK